MPNHDCHLTVGGVVGGAAAIACALDQPPLVVFLEALGGVLGGQVGGCAPDWVDPPVHSYHRSFGHGAIPTVAVGGAVISAIPEWQRSLRASAAQFAQRCGTATTDGDRLLAYLAMVACHLLAGALPGVVAGYASHLVMDLGTPRRLPLLG